MSKKTSQNPLLCDPDSGVCELPQIKTESKTSLAPEKKPVRIVYFTDPICSSCWGIEPQLRRLKLEYGEEIEIEYHMGGLLPSWDVYDSGGIGKPSDVAHHWDEVSLHYHMPIDGDVWLEDPLSSSYPPSIAFKAAQSQDNKKAIKFLRKIKEMVFLEKKNITKWEYLQEAAGFVQLDLAKFKVDFENQANQLFQDDLALGKKLGVRGFPTIFVENAAGQQTLIYGVRPYAKFKDAVLNLYPEAVKTEYKNSPEGIFNYYKTLTTQEFAVLTDHTFEKSESLLEGLLANGKIKKHHTKNGDLWIWAK